MGFKIPESNNAGYLRYSTWSLQPKDNPTSKKPILATDTILLKSSLGNFVRLEEYGNLKADSSTITDKSYWNFCKARIPFVPNWARVKPYISAAYLTPSLNEPRLEESQTPKKGKLNRLI